MKKYINIAALILLAIFCTSIANAQYTVREYFASVARSNEPFRPLQRIELGYGFYNMNTANFQFDYNKTDINNQLIDTYYVATMKPTAAMSASFGLHFPIAMLRNRGVVAVATTFAFNAGALDGEQKVYQPRGFIRDSSNTIWGMQFVWPIKADYRIVYLDQEYQYTVIGRTRRDYVWIMARAPQISAAKYLELTQLLEPLHDYCLDEGESTFRLQDAEHLQPNHHSHKA